MSEPFFGKVVVTGLEARGQPRRSRGLLGVSANMSSRSQRTSRLSATRTRCTRDGGLQAGYDNDGKIMHSIRFFACFVKQVFTKKSKKRIIWLT